MYYNICNFESQVGSFSVPKITTNSSNSNLNYRFL